MGEYSASVAAGIQSYQDSRNMCRVFAKINALVEDGVMAVVFAEEKVIANIIHDVMEAEESTGADWLDISSKNSRTQFVLAGTSKSMNRVLQKCKEEKISLFVLPVTKTYHTRGVDPCLEVFRKELEI